MFEKMKKNPWNCASVIFGLIILICEYVLASQGRYLTNVLLCTLWGAIIALNCVIIFKGN